MLGICEPLVTTIVKGRVVSSAFCNGVYFNTVGFVVVRAIEVGK